LWGAREREKLPRVFWEAAMSSSSPMQQVQCPCAKSNSFEGHKSSSSTSTTACRRESSTRRSLLLRVCVHPQSQFTHQQLLQCARFLPRVHRIETEATIRAPGECKLSCVVPLSVCVYCLPLVVCLPKIVDVISSEANQKIAHVVCETQYDLIVTSMWSKCMTWKEVFLQFFVDPSHWWDHRPVTEHHSCQSSHVNGAIALVGVSLVALCWLLQSCCGLNLAEILFRSFALVG
jgi:hypothetical protein